ncbi:diaminopimelate epimerase [Robiginitomaculum antarcticum]|uniref:diaminopimelate epimerase n=1 Tax=Robiginitomaculum antarcticum TaxID=437507 RepID=UPI000476A6B9|nr:diaminopimelate epimerase [Robiginitomaculum antarcticum]
MKLYVMNGAGNRFAIFDARGSRFRMSPDMAVKTGARGGPLGDKGADQIIVLHDPLPGSDAQIFMDIWNNDGGHVDACGNASRCAAWLLMRESGGDNALIQTAIGVLHATRKGELSIAVDMGKPRLGWEDIPLSEAMHTHHIDVKVGPIDNPVLSNPGAVNMGNPHCVFFVDDVMATDIERLGPMLEFYPLFPQQANIGFAQIIADDHIRLRVWERGAGLTLACGTGACAAVVAGVRQHRLSRLCRVDVDGGRLDIHWRGSDDHVIMTGPIELEHEGEMPL